MSTRQLFRHEPDVIWVPDLNAFVHTRLPVGVDGDIIQDDLAPALESGDLTEDDQEIAAFCGASFDVSASIFPVALDRRGHGQRLEEEPPVTAALNRNDRISTFLPVWYTEGIVWVV